jgi:electron transfer flavoprotein-quinone oxidoreductase
MSEFDAIVVGAGPAGASAAIRLALSKKNVLLVEKSDPPGSKNVSGGVLWGNGLSAVIPEWEKTAPLERFVDTKSVAFLTQDSKISIDFSSKKLEQKKTGYTVLRTKFDQWLAKKAKEAGAMVINGVTVEKLHMEGGKVTGVDQEGDIITADTVILCEGANPRVAIASGLHDRMSDHDVAIGVKEVISLPENTINERFNLKSGAGFACEYVLGYLKDGNQAGGFLYTNKDSISIGIVVSMSHLRANGETHSYDLIQEFLDHPYIAPLIAGGKMQEYSAHLVQEGGIRSMPKVYGNGYMIAGDSAGFSFSNGLVLQGMNYAIDSGVAAADAFMKAQEKGDYSEKSLSVYQDLLESSYVMRDMKTFRGIEEVTWSPFVHKQVPAMLESLMMSLYMEEGKPKKHITGNLMEAMSKSGMLKTSSLLETYRMIRRM